MCVCTNDTIYRILYELERAKYQIRVDRRSSRSSRPCAALFNEARFDDDDNDDNDEGDTV